MSSHGAIPLPLLGSVDKGDRRPLRINWIVLGCHTDTKVFERLLPALPRRWGLFILFFLGFMFAKSVGILLNLKYFHPLGYLPKVAVCIPWLCVWLIVPYIRPLILAASSRL